MSLPLVREPPRFLFLQLNQRCNLKCTHCTFHELNDDDRSGYLSLARRAELMREFKALGGDTLVTCGGEPMLDFEDYFTTMIDAREAGLRSLSVINGTRVANERTADRMIADGPSEITVSLDGHDAEIHDKHRGVKGSFDVATRAVRLLVAARERARSTKPIYVMTILCADTWRHLFEFYDFVLYDLQADKLKVNVLQPSFGLPGKDHYFEGQMPREVDQVMALLRSCDRHYRLNLNPRWLEHVEMYLRSANANGRRLAGWTSGKGTAYPICNTYDRNIMVDVWGGAKLCFSEAFPGMSVREPGALAKFWREFSVPVREQMRSCTKYCGISHSVRREPATQRSQPDPDDRELARIAGARSVARLQAGEVKVSK